MTDREDEARQAFAEKLALTGGRLIVAASASRPYTIGRPEMHNFDIKLKDGTVYQLLNIPACPFREATRDEMIAGTLAYMPDFDWQNCPHFPQYVELSFD